MQNNEIKKDEKKKRKLPKWINWRYIGLAVGTSVLLCLTMILLYK